jgi:hypothetical protein
MASGPGEGSVQKPAEGEGSSEAKGEGEAKGVTAEDFQAMQDANDELTAKVTELEAKIAEQNEAMAKMSNPETTAKLQAFVAADMSRFRTAFGLPPVDYTAMSAESLVRDYEPMKAQFEANFKAGSLSGNRGKNFEQEKEDTGKTYSAIELAAANGKIK